MNQQQYGFNYGAQPYGVQQQQMYGYNPQPVKQPGYTNPLGAAKIKELLSKGSGAAKIAITEEDFNEALCTHRFEGTIRTYDMQDGSGKVKCAICGAEFVPVEGAEIQDIQAATDTLVNILHTAKLAWLDMSDKTGKEFFQTIAIIKKTPELFKIAMRNFSEYDNSMNNYNTTYPISGFGVFNQILGPSMGQPQYQGYQPQQPYNNQMYNTPQNYGQPVNYAAQQMQSAAPGSNGFGYYTEPVQQQQQSGYQPQQQAQQQAAPAPAAKGETVSKQLHV